MRRIIFAAVAVAAIALAGSPQGQAGMITLSLESDDDLSTLHSGQTVTFRAVLSGVGDSDGPTELTDLGVGVAFDSAIFGLPTVTHGSVIPDPDGIVGTTESTGFVDLTYDSLFSFMSATITTNGTFFSFDVPVVGTGSGTVAIESADTLDFNVDSIGGVGTSLSVTSLGSTNVVPEPGTLALLGSGTVMLGGAAGWRRRRRERCFKTGRKAVTRNE